MFNHSKQIFAMILFSYAGATYAAGDEAPVAVKTDGLPEHVAQKVREKAAEGATELRRYVWITRGMHGLDMRSLVVAESQQAIARDEKPAPTMVAKAKE